jgi:SAM-dependent MidA family methyltransferase
VGANGWTTMRAAWHAALYGPSGFYRFEQPRDHFRTSSHVSTGLAAAALSLARRHGAETIVDIGAGAGELLTAVRALDRELCLVGVDLRQRPTGLPDGVEWLRTDDEGPAAVASVVAGRTLLIANELLDNVPADVVELTDDGLREVEAQPSTGAERLGGPAEASSASWVDQWWPLWKPGQRAIVGLARDQRWSALCAAVPDGVCVAIDFGHLLADRPGFESPVSYRRGRQGSARFDGRHDITAGVAVDAVAAAVGARVERQRDVLPRHVERPDRPDQGLAGSDPMAYLRRLGAIGDWHELTSRDGLGDFWWIETTRSGPTMAASMGVESEVAR